MKSESAAEMVFRFFDSDDPDAVRYVRSAFKVWMLHGDLPLHRVLGIGPTPVDLKLLGRNKWLRMAANHLSGDLSARAKVLCREARRFESRVWPIWRRASAPPPGSDAVCECLFNALRSGARLPTSARQYMNILRAGNEM